MIRSIFLLVLLAGAAGPAASAASPADEFVLVPGGCFEMGCAPSEAGDCGADEVPRHRVCLADFLLARTEVTVASFRAFVEGSGYRTDAERLGGCYLWTGLRWEKRVALSWRDPGFAQTPEDPVVCVSARDAAAYIGWRNERDGGGFRLPTEAEWEYAARNRGAFPLYPWPAGDGGPSGNLANPSMRPRFRAWPWPFFRNYEDGFVHTAPAAELPANPLGLYGMDGNVEEWTGDVYRAGAYRSPALRPPGGKGAAAPDRAIRGGSWMASPWFSRAVDRKHGRPWSRGGHLGFRLARSPGPGAGGRLRSPSP